MNTPTFDINISFDKNLINSNKVMCCSCKKSYQIILYVSGTPRTCKVLRLSSEQLPDLFGWLAGCLVRCFTQLFSYTSPYFGTFA